MLAADIREQNVSKHPFSKGTSPGVIQRFEIQMEDDQQQSQSQSCCFSPHQLEIIAPPSDAPNSIRCPYCRTQQYQLLCVSCVCTDILRIPKVRDELGRLQRCKTAVSQLIETALAAEIKFESDLQKIKRSIESLKTNIAWKKDIVSRLRQRIANMDTQSQRNQKNVVLLENKTVSHNQRIQRTNAKISEVHNLLTNTESKLNEQHKFISKYIVYIFRLEKRQLFAAGDQPIKAWTGRNKVHRAAYLLDNCLCLDRVDFFSKGHSQTATDPPPAATMVPDDSMRRHSHAALVFAAQLAEVLAFLFDFHLPYSLLHKTLALLSLKAEIELHAKALFKLDFAVLHLCLACGVAPEECELTNPLANLFGLLSLLKDGKIRMRVPRLDQRLYRQICEQFSRIQPNGRVLSEFTLDNVENDWVKVHCS